MTTFTGRLSACFRASDVPADVFTHIIRNLDNAAHGCQRVPAGARDAQSVGAGELKLARSHHDDGGSVGRRLITMLLYVGMLLSGSVLPIGARTFDSG